MSASNYLENALLDHVLGNTAYTQPTNLYVGLFTSDPTDAGTGTEVSGGNYARKVVTFSAAASGSTSNSADILFPTSTSSWGTISHAAVFDSLAGGNMLFHTSLSASKAVATDDTILITAGNLTINLD